MELIDAYVKEVGERLPEKQRADLEQEIRSMIEDTLEDESRAQGREADEAMLVGVLKKLGPPQKMADAYLPPRYLIGPELFPVYWMILRITLAVILLTAAIGAGLGLAFSTGQMADIAAALLKSAGGLVDGIFYSFGVITFIFAILQWVVPVDKITRSGQEWDPLKLKGKKDEDRIKPSSLIGEAIGLVIALVFINFFAQLIGIGAVHDGQWTFVSILSPAFYSYIPWLSLVWVAQTGLRIVVAFMTRWTPATRWVQVGIHLAGIGLLYRMLTGPSLVDLAPDKLAVVLSGISPSALQGLATGIEQSVHLAVAFILIMSVISLAVELYRLLLKGRLPMLRVPRAE